MNALISRRSFIARLFAAAAALAIKVPAADSRRSPYVAEGECVSYIGRAGRGFIGAQIVSKVLPWDGTGYPVETLNNCFGPSRAIEIYYDFDLCDFDREVPDRFWWDPENCRKYPNVHTYVRTKRFGENIHQAIRSIGGASIKAEEFPVS